MSGMSEGVCALTSSASVLLARGPYTYQVSGQHGFRSRQADRQTDRQTDRQAADGQTSRQTNTETVRQRQTDRDRQTDRQTDGQTDRQTDRRTLSDKKLLSQLKIMKLGKN